MAQSVHIATGVTATRRRRLRSVAQAEVQNFELWRWFFFVGGIAPIWWVGDFVVRLLVFLVESAFLNTRNVMYFLVAVRVSRVALLSLCCQIYAMREQGTLACMPEAMFSCISTKDKQSKVERSLHGQCMACTRAHGDMLKC